MATISSLGIGSGLDTESIVKKLADLERSPLSSLKLKATATQAKITAYGQVKSQFASLQSAAEAMLADSAWKGVKTSSSNSTAATMTATQGTLPTSFTLDVDMLARSQSLASASLTAGSPVGAGTLTIQRGTWSGGAADPVNPTAAAPTFAAGAAAAVDITVTASDTVTTVAEKINAANAGVVATVFKDATGERLLLRSKDTGAASGFRVQASVDADGFPADNAGLSRLAFDPETGAFGMGSGSQPVQYAQDGRARINGLAVTSANNVYADNVPGVTITASQVTTTNYGQLSEARTPLTLTVSEDVTPAVKSIGAFVDAYNKLITNLSELTKYDAGTKTPGAFQGDSAVVGVLNVLRTLTGSTSTGSAYQRLSDIGLEVQRDGTLSQNSTKMGVAANNGDELKKLFTQNNGSSQSNGFALKFRDLAKAVLQTGGAVSNKTVALEKELTTNATEQQRVNDRADRTEARLRKQYSTLDTKMASLTALNNYITQQVTQWNKSSN